MANTRTATNRANRHKNTSEGIAIAGLEMPVNGAPLWSLGITELNGRNIETAGREEVNKMLADGWVLLHIYTLKYREDGVWRERPMAILGR